MAEVKPIAEADMIALLRGRYGAVSGNGRDYAFVAKVRDAAGHGATRTCDALAMSLWPSRGLELHGHEIKCSRSDWLRELKDPSKAEAFAKYCHRWWLVVSDAKIVKDGELPAPWGLMVRGGGGLRVKVQAPFRTESGDRLPRSFIAPLLRAAVETGATREEVAKARADGLAMGEARRTPAAAMDARALKDLRARVAAFEKAAGFQMECFSGWQGYLPETVGAAVKAVLDGGPQIDQTRQGLERLARNAELLAQFAREAADASA